MSHGFSYFALSPECSVWYSNRCRTTFVELCPLSMARQNLIIRLKMHVKNNFNVDSMFALIRLKMDLFGIKNKRTIIWEICPLDFFSYAWTPRLGINKLFSVIYIRIIAYQHVNFVRASTGVMGDIFLVLFYSSSKFPLNKIYPGET